MGGRPARLQRRLLGTVIFCALLGAIEPCRVHRALEDLLRRSHRRDLIAGFAQDLPRLRIGSTLARYV